jgi:hypothetical protein
LTLHADRGGPMRAKTMRGDPGIVEVAGRSVGMVRLAITEKGRTMIVR